MKRAIGVAVFSLIAPGGLAEAGVAQSPPQQPQAGASFGAVSPSGPLSSVDLGRVIVLALQSPGDEFHDDGGQAFAQRAVDAWVGGWSPAYSYDKSTKLLRLGVSSNDIKLASVTQQLPSKKVEAPDGRAYEITHTKTTRMAIALDAEGNALANQDMSDAFQRLRWSATLGPDDAIAMLKSVHVRVIGHLARRVVSAENDTHYASPSQPFQNDTVTAAIHVHASQFQLYDERNNSILASSSVR